VGELVVTHFWPTSDPRRHEDEAAEAFGRRVGVALPGKTFTA